MKSRYGPPALALAMLPGLIVGGPSWSQDGRPEYVPNELLIKLKDGVAEAQIQSLLATVQTETVEQFQLVPIYHVSVPNGTFLQAQASLTDHPAVEYVERNYYRYIDAAPNDPQYPSMWGLDNTGQTGGTPDADIDAPQAWDLTTGDGNLVVAVIDSGIDLGHEDL
ncbi:MAG: peptidase S8, partial [Pseudomonadota bacterium]|nr:peptidase S8 [Pseudomonadota bacterium]